MKLIVIIVTSLIIIIITTVITINIITLVLREVGGAVLTKPKVLRRPSLSVGQYTSREALKAALLEGNAREIIHACVNCTSSANMGIPLSRGVGETCWTCS